MNLKVKRDSFEVQTNEDLRESIKTKRKTLLACAVISHLGGVATFVGGMYFMISGFANHTLSGSAGIGIMLATLGVSSAFLTRTMCAIEELTVVRGIQ